MSVSTPQTTMLRPIWKPSGKHLNALKTHRGRASRHHGSKIRVCLRGSTPFNGKKNNVEETVHPPKHTNGNGDAPSHYGLLLINHGIEERQAGDIQRRRSCAARRRLSAQPATAADRGGAGRRIGGPFSRHGPPPLHRHRRPPLSLARPGGASPRPGDARPGTAGPVSFTRRSPAGRWAQRRGAL